MIPELVGIGPAVGVGGNSPRGQWPAGHRAGDHGLLFVGASDLIAAPAGWDVVAQIDALLGDLNPNVLNVFRKRAQGNNESDVWLGAPTSYAYAVMAAVRGSRRFGNPIVAQASDVQLVASTAVAVPGAVTPVKDCLVLLAVGRGRDNAAAHFSDWANPDLANVLERHDAGTTSGNGGGLGIASGEKAVAGAFGPTTALLSFLDNQARLALALAPMEEGLDAVRAIIEQHLLDQWAGRTEPIAFTGVAFEPPADLGFWMRCTVRFGDAFEDAMGVDEGGTRGSRVAGVVILNVFGKPGRGDGPLVALADIARGVFNMQDVDGVRFGPTSPPTPPETDRQGWRGVALFTPFEVDETT